MTPKLWGYVGIALAVLALSAVVIGQANSLMKKGVELGKAKAIEKDLREEIKQLRDRYAEEVRVLKESNQTCLDGLTEAEAIGAAWREDFEAISLRPPREVIVEIESTTWVESLQEGHEKLLTRIEGIRNAEVPYPPG